MKLKFFITGGTGFIGRHLVKSILERGYEVTIFDNLSNSSEKKVSNLLDSGANLVRGDIRDHNLAEKVVGHDSVIHLAAKISVIDSFTNPDETYSVNVEGTINLLKACMKNKIQSFVAASSAAVYGDLRDPKTFASEKSKTEPISPYGLSKLVMEQKIEKFSNEYNFNSIILRFFNIYGKGQSPEYAGVITKFMNMITLEKPLEIFGDGKQTRDFIAIHDAIDSIHNAIQKMDNKRGRIYNIASGKPITIKNLAELMILVSGKKLGIQYSKSKKGEIRYSQGDISLAKNDLEYYPKIELKDGINLLNLDDEVFS